MLPYNEKGEEAGSLYVFEHEDVIKGTIEFLRREGRKYYIRWSGTANVFWNDEYGADVPFAFEEERTPMNIIFDMDGLMFDTERVFIEAWDYAGEKIGIGKAGYMVYKT